jgi:hypothetical protein
VVVVIVVLVVEVANGVWRMCARPCRRCRPF